MRILFMGTPEFALPSLSILLDNSYEIPAVVTVPDKPQGRGRKTSQSPVKQAALERGLTVLQPATLKDPSFLAELSDLKPDLIVVVAFRILPPEVFTLPPLGTLNLHASLLPKYRGAAPINWAIIHGEEQTGVTTFFIRQAVDTGSILLQARVRIGPDETAGELHDTLAAVGAEIVLHTVRLIEAGKPRTHDQDDTHATNAPKIFTRDCRIDWSKSAGTVHNFIRGLSPLPTAWTMHGERTIKIYRSQVSKSAKRGKPGTVLHATGDSLLVGTGDGVVTVLELQQEGRRRMTASEFLRGYPLHEGDSLA